MLDIIHRPIFYLKHNNSEKGFCLYLEVEHTQLGPIDRARLSPDCPLNVIVIQKEFADATHEIRLRDVTFWTYIWNCIELKYVSTKFKNFPVMMYDVMM
jgi:hypothetical protein